MSRKFDRLQLRKLIQQEISNLGEDILVLPNAKRQGSPPLSPQMIKCSACGSSMYEDEGSCMECGAMYEKSDTLNEGDCGCASDCGCRKKSDDSMVGFLSGHAASDVAHRSGAYMSKSQLYKVSRYAARLYDMIPDHHDLEDWIRTKISQIADDIGEVYHALDYDQYEGDV